MNLHLKYSDHDAQNDLIKCTICPRSCRTDRTRGPTGWCKTDSGFNVSSICIHKGEEPVISGQDGICNVFFGHCNLQCIFCQNYQISQNGTSVANFGTLDQITEEIITCLDKGCKSVGFVSASHMVPQMIMIINSLHRWERYPTIVYNSNGYDKVETLKRLEGIVDVYLPDFKYSDNVLGKELSDVKDYLSVAQAALKEMYRQMGPKVITDEKETAVRGLIIRHLVLPAEVENSINVLRFIESELSPKVSISLMAQYHPVAGAIGHKTIGRQVTIEEYKLIVNELENLGFSNGWIQELESSANYLPDFNWNHPFEKTA
ncbi:MAG: radical SAM protein [Chloroflexota bacterium]|nr:radical SAM protein [Lentimicrobium sp.]